MLQDPLTLYKLIILYMINLASFPITTAQISDFILGRDYTNFITLQSVISELSEANLIATETIRNRTHLSVTEEGLETLHFFENRISDAIKQDIVHFFQDNEYTMRNEVSIVADYYKTTSGEYHAHLLAKERECNLIDLTLSVPTKELASHICDNWQKKNEEIYQYLIDQLF